MLRSFIDPIMINLLFFSSFICPIMSSVERISDAMEEILAVLVRIAEIMERREASSPGPASGGQISEGDFNFETLGVAGTSHNRQTSDPNEIARIKRLHVETASYAGRQVKVYKEGAPHEPVFWSNRGNTWQSFGQLKMAAKWAVSL